LLIENNSKSKQILSVTVKERKKHLIVKCGSGTKLVIVPVDAPEVDPYDTKTGNGFMTPNAIVKSGLSANAKLMYMVLRSCICFGLGVVYPKEDTLETLMSKSRGANRRAIAELVKYGVVRKVKSPWGGRLKNYYYLNQDSEWRLPEPIKFASHGNEIGDRDNFRDIDTDIE